VTGIYSIYNATYAGSYGFLQQSIPANVSYAPQMTIELQAQSSIYGSIPYGPVPVTIPGSTSLFPQTPSVDSCVLGLCSILPNPNSWVELGAFFILIVIGGSFGAFAAPIGLLVTAVMAALFAAAKWLPISTDVTATVITIAVVGLIVWLERRGR
jgi:hypothetical protein